jgi:hypothetical protein
MKLFTISFLSLHLKQWSFHVSFIRKAVCLLCTMSFLSPFVKAQTKLHGVTQARGLFPRGGIFSYDNNNEVFKNLDEFDGSNGAMPKGNLLLAWNDKLYGTIIQGEGSNGYDNIFSFDHSTNSYNSFGALVLS